MWAGGLLPCLLVLLLAAGSVSLPCPGHLLDAGNVWLDSANTGPKGCCKPEAEINNLFGEAFDKAFGSLDTKSSLCKEYIDRLNSAVCSPYSSQFLNTRDGNALVRANFRICSNFCVDLKSECELDASPDDVCVDLVEKVSNAAWNPIVSSDGYCFSQYGDCTENDFVGSYTPCMNGVRSAIYQWKSDIKCTVGLLPPPQTNLPCDVTCAAGTYLPVGSNECRECSPGHFSLGGGVTVDEWHEWPTRFSMRTYCLQNFLDRPDYFEPAVDCSWVLGGDVVSSGDTLDSRDNILVVEANFVRPGYITFVYKVDAETFFDGLTFAIDGVIRLHMMSSSVGWRKLNYTVDAGFHNFTWTYHKDVDTAEGDDDVKLKMIELSGVLYADSFCERCGVGTYTDLPRQSACQSCPPNTYAGEEGSTRCLACSADTFAVGMGASECIPRQPCKEEDQYPTFSACERSGNSLTHRKEWKFVEPKICREDVEGAVKLRPVETLPCGDCNPGTYRNGTECKNCAPGSFSDGKGECKSCEAGTAAVPVQMYTNWHEMPKDFMTACLPISRCGMNGWRVTGDTIDSGVGHSSYVYSVLFIPVRVETPGSLSFNATLMCGEMPDCHMELHASSTSRRFQSYEPTFNIVKQGLDALPLEVGEYNITLVFDKEDPHGFSRDARVAFHWIRITGTDSGGAAECTKCPAGTHADTNGSRYCAPCPAGTFSADEASKTCRQCAENTYSKEGATECSPCPDGTKSTPGSDECRSDCSFTVEYSSRTNELVTATYDLNDLAGTNTTLYPIYAHQKTLHLAMCNKKTTGACVNDEGKPYPTYGCEVSRHGNSYSLGDTISFLSIQDDPSGGLIVEYLMGEAGGECSRRRQATIRMVCKPDAGPGLPQWDESLSNQECHYYFIWESMYACPLCTRSDYRWTNGECLGGSMEQTAVWLTNPKRCHGGVELPGPKVVACTAGSLKNCDPGQYMDEQVGKCVDALPGFYVPSAGAPITFWSASSLPSYLELKGFKAQNNSIDSGPNDTQLVARINFEEKGSLSFKYKVFGHSFEQTPVFQGFSFYLDTKRLLGPVVTTMFKYDTFTIDDIEVGTHILTWEFQGGDEDTSQHLGKGVSIVEMSISGFSYLPTKANVCPPGTFSDRPASQTCAPCEQNTYSRQSECVPCQQGFAAIQGDPRGCWKRPPCLGHDYDSKYTDCVDGTRQRTKVKLEPGFCVGGYEPNTESMVASCATCPMGKFDILNSDNVRTGCGCCDGGKVYRGNRTDVGTDCVDTPAGSFARTVVPFFQQGITEKWPDGWVTGCSGPSCGGGWRQRSTGVDSGVHTTSSDTYLQANVTLEVDGFVEFQYEMHGTNPTNRFAFFVDGREVLDLPFRAPDRTGDGDSDKGSEGLRHVELPAGSHVLLWNYHQASTASEVNSESSHIVWLTNIVIGGMAGGCATEVLTCPKGTFSDHPNGIVCHKCPAGTFTDHEGSEGCTKCADGKYAPISGYAECKACSVGFQSSEDRTFCQSDDCLFRTAENVTYDLGSLSFTDMVPGLSLCKPHPCGPSGMLSYFCRNNNTQTAFNAGTHISFAPTTSSETGNSTFTVTLSDGDACDDGHHKTLFEFHCNREKPSSTPTEVKVDKCTSLFKWEHPVGCHVCSEEDYEIKDTPCEDGKKMRSYYMRGDSPCNGPFINSQEEMDCSDGGGSIPAGLIVSAIVVFIVLISIIVGVVVYNRKLTTKYERLIEERVGGNTGDYELS